MPIHLAESDQQIAHCFPVMAQLRPHLEPIEFVDRVQRQRQMGYHLAFLEVDDRQTDRESDSRVVAVAGFRLSECLATGTFLYVDDLVVDAAARSRQYGQHLFEWLMDYGKRHHCQQLRLDSGVQRFEAHRFYFRQRMSIVSHHFARKL